MKKQYSYCGRAVKYKTIGKIYKWSQIHMYKMVLNNNWIMVLDKGCHIKNVHSLKAQQILS